MALKIIIVVLLVAIVISLFSGLFFLLHDRSRSHRTANALLLRVGLSVLLLLVLFYGFQSGQLGVHAPWIAP